MSKFRIGTYFDNKGKSFVVDKNTTEKHIESFAKRADKSVIDAIKSPRELTERVRARLVKEKRAEKKEKKKDSK